MAPPSKRAVLPARVRLAWLTEVGTLLEAGIPLVRALQVVSDGAGDELAPAASVAARQVEGGRPLAHAGRASRLLDPVDAKVIEAGEQAGRLPAVLKRLAEALEKAINVRARIRARLALPAAVIVLALLVAPLPALVGGEISVNVYLMASMGRAVALFAVIWVLVALLSRARGGGPLALTIARVELALPWVGAIQRRRSVNGFLDTVATAHEAGVPLADAIPLAAKSIRNPLVATPLRDAGRRLGNGESLTDVLADWPYLDAGTHSLLRSGEAAGDLGASLARIVSLETDRLDDDDRQLGEWLPRVIYFTVVAWLVSQILGGGGGAFSSL